ncbi:MAG: PilZ domain-containing protein [Terriglobia bacterium]
MQSDVQADFRRWEREAIAISASLALRGEKLGSDTFAATIDISLSGVSVHTELALAPKQEVEVVIKGEFSRTIVARVIWVRRDQSGDGTVAGLKFLPYTSPKRA